MGVQMRCKINLQPLWPDLPMIYPGALIVFIANYTDLSHQFIWIDECRFFLLFTVYGTKICATLNESRAINS